MRQWGVSQNAGVLVGSVNGLAPNRWQAITRTDVDTVLWYHMTSLGHNELTHWGLWQMFCRHFQIHFHENTSVLIQISLKFDPYGPVENKWVLVQVMAWHLTGNYSQEKPLAKPIMTQLTNASGHNELTHWGRVMHICLIKLSHHWFR